MNSIPQVLAAEGGQREGGQGGAGQGDAGQQVVPPPVPLYGSHIAKTSVLAPGIIVIDTDDSFDTVLAWYRANLKDSMADVTLGKDHQHFLTHKGAGVDISAESAGGRKRTKISLLWKPAGSGAYATLAPPSPDRKVAGEPAPPQPAKEMANAAPPAVPLPPQAPPEQTVAEAVMPVKPIPVAPAQTAVPLAPVEKIEREIAALPQPAPEPAPAPRSVPVPVPVPAPVVANAAPPARPLPPAATVSKTPAGKTPAGKTPAGKTPVVSASPAVTSPAPEETAAEAVAPVEAIPAAPAQTVTPLAPVEEMPSEIAMLPEAPREPAPRAAGATPPSSALPSALAEKVAEAIALAKPAPAVHERKRPDPISVPEKQAPLKPEPQKPEAQKPETPDREASVPRHEPNTVETRGLEFFRAGQYAEAILAWEDAAAAGNADAALALGMMYDAGEGVPQSYPQALNWYRMAAEGGSTAGAFNLGAMYDAGFGVRQNTAEAADWYERAAAKGSGRAAFNLALLFQSGDGVPQDAGSAGRYFRQAAHLGVTAARSHLNGSRSDDDGDAPFDTIHVISAEKAKRNSDQAITERLRVAADDGDPTAQYDLAYRLERGTTGDIDLRQAYALYTQAARAAPDSRLKAIADAGASQVKSHLEAAGPRR
jgi:TPR repeat protein